MSTMNNLLPLSTWMRSRQAILLVGLLLAAAYALASFYYSGSAQKAENVIITPETGTVPSIPVTSTADIQTGTSISGSGPAETKIRVNGQNIPVPQSGAVHKVIQNGNGTTSVDVSVQSNTSSGQGSNSSTNVELNSSSVEFSSTTEASQ